MFARIMAVVIACIVLLTLSFGALSAVTVRNQQINARLEALTKEAREIAFLAANNQASSMALMFGYDDDIQKYIDWKSKNIWETYGAYILVVDRLGRVMDNLSLAMTEDPDFVSAVNNTGNLSRCTLKGKTLISGKGAKTKISGSDQVAVTGKNNIKGYSLKTVKSGNFLFVGSGYGHGIGMSQSGARGMAEAGFGYKEILMHYFTGVEVN